MATVKNKAQLDLQAIQDGRLASQEKELINVIATGGTVSFEYSPQGVATPQSIILAATLSGYLQISPVYKWQYLSTASQWTDFPNETSSTLVLAHDNAAWGQLKSLQVRCVSRGYFSQIVLLKNYEPSQPVVDTSTPPTPTNFTASAGLTSIQLSWVYPSTYTNYSHTEIWRATSNVLANAVLISTTTASLYSDAVGSTNTEYYYWIRFVSKASVYSEYNSSGGTYAKTGKVGTADLNTLIVEAGNLANSSVNSDKLANAAVTTAKFASGIEPVTIVTSVPATKSTNTIFNTTDSKTYRWNGTSYVATVSTADLSGTISDAQIAGLAASKVTGQLSDSQIAAVAAAKLTGTVATSQIADAAVTTAKFASGIEPVTVVTSVPTTKSTNTIFNTTDSKTYRWNGTSYVATVSTADLSGTISDAQIAGLAASKVTGQLSDSQIAAVAAAKLTGTVATSQIADAAVTTAKFASGIEPVTVVTSVPTTKSTNTIFNTTDNKTYRWNGTSYVAAVSTADLSGTISDAQIAGLAASKVTGQLSDSQIAAVAAAKLTGTVATSQIADAAVTTAKFASSIEPVTVVTSVPTTKSTNTIFNTTDNKTYRWNGTSYVATIPTADLTGTVTSSQIADAAVTTAKFASSIEPVTIVTSVPTTKSTNTIFNTTDSKTYRWNGTSYVATIPTADLTGTISDAQIAALAASKVTGQLSDSQLAAISSAKISGQLTNAQIAAVAATKVTGQLVASQLNVNIGGGNLLPNTKFNLKNTTNNIPHGYGAYNNSGIDVTFTNPTARTGGNAFGLRAGATTTTTFGLYTSNGAIAGGITGGIPGGWRTNTTYTISFYAKKVAGPTIVKMGYGWNVAPTTETDILNPNLTTDWQRYVRRITWGNSVETDTGALYLTVTGTVVSGDEIHICELQVEEGDIATAYSPKATEILPGTITSTEISDNAITTPKLVAGAITTGKIAAGAVTANELSAGSITAGKIAAGAVTASTIDANAVTAEKIAASAITAEKIAAGTITSEKIAADTITAANIAAGAITATELAAGAVTAGKIAAGSIQAADISAGTITGDKLAANTITGSKIAADTITSGNIAAGAITADEISSGAITTAKLAAGAVTADTIASNAITTGKLAAGAVTADQIASNAITTGKIAAGAITADQIASNAVTTGKLLVTGRGAALNDDPGCQDPASWQNGDHGSTATQVTLSDGVFGSFAFRSAQTGGPASVDTVKYYPVSFGKKYRLSAWARKNTDGNGKFFLRLVSPVNGQLILGVENQFLTTSWQKFSTEFTPASANDNRVRVRAILNWDSSAGYHEVTDIRLEEKTEADLIVDGAITASKINAGAVTTAALAAGAVTADTIASNAVTSAKIEAGAITTAKLDAGAVNASKIAAGTITGDRIAGNTITGANIAADTITAGNIAAGAITASEVAAGAITTSKLTLTDLTNIAENGDFEAGQVGWDVSANITNDPANAYAGNWVLAMPGPGSGAYAIRNNLIIPVAPGEDYYADAFIKGTGTATGYVRIRGLNNSNSEIWTQASQAVTGATYQQVSVTGTVPANVVRINVELVANSGTGTIYVDRVRMLRRANASLIVDGAITASKINAGAVTTAALAAGAVTADTIASNAVTSAKIEAGAITTAKLDAGAVNASKIAAGTITGDRIAGNTITGANIAADTITAGNIAAGAISADEIASNAITTSKLLVTGRGAALNDDPGITDPTAWTADPRLIYQTSAGGTAAGKYFWDISSGVTGTDIFVTSRRFPINPARTYSATAQLFVDSDNTRNMYVTVRMWDDQGVELSGAQTGWGGTYAGYTFGGLPTPGTWARYGGQFGTGIQNRPIPSNVKEAAVMVWFRYSGNGSGASRQAAQDIRCEEVSGADLIVDGAITASKINAGAVTTAALAAGAVTADTIASNAVTSAKIEAGAITTAKLDAGAVNASKIAAGTITGDRIAGNTITGANIAADTITAGNIAAGAISASEVAAGAITAEKLTISSFGDSVILNPGFEEVSSTDPTLPARWNRNGVWGGTSETVFRTTTGEVRSGSASLTLVPGAGGSADAYADSVAVGEGEQWFVSCVAKASGTNAGTSPGFYLRVRGGTTQTSIGVELYPGAAENQVVPTTWTKYQGVVTIPAGMRWARPIVLNYSTNTGVTINVDEVEFKKLVVSAIIADGAINANKIAANAIAVGTAAIQNGAIVNAMIGTAAIDSAKIADAAITTAKIGDAAITAAKIGDAEITNAKISDLNASKITAGTISADRIAAGSITASKIDTTGLTIKDLNGNVILGAGTALSTSNITGLGTFATKSSLSANEVSGLGAFATLGQITSGNASTYIADLAVDTLRIAVNAITGGYTNSVSNINVSDFGAATWKQMLTVDTSGQSVFANSTAIVLAIRDNESDTRAVRLRKSGGTATGSWVGTKDPLVDTEYGNPFLSDGSPLRDQLLGIYNISTAGTLQFSFDRYTYSNADPVTGIFINNIAISIIIIKR